MTVYVYSAYHNILPKGHNFAELLVQLVTSNNSNSKTWITNSSYK